MNIVIVITLTFFNIALSKSFITKEVRFGPNNHLLFVEPIEFKPSMTIYLSEDIDSFCHSPSWRDRRYEAKVTQLDGLLPLKELSQIGHERVRFADPEAHVQNTITFVGRSKKNISYWEQELNKNVNLYKFSFLEGDRISLGPSEICSIYSGKLKIHSNFTYYQNPSKIIKLHGFRSNRLSKLQAWEAGREMTRILRATPEVSERFDPDLLQKLYEREINIESFNFLFNQKNNFFRTNKTIRREYEIFYKIKSM